MRRSGAALIAALSAALVAVLPAQAVGAAESGAPTVERGTYEDAEGSRERVVVTPAGGAEGAPVLVAMHGCSQTADDVVTGWRLEALSARTGALVIAPEQPSSANTLSCWNWFLPEHQRRGSGEPALLAGLIEDVIAEHSADAERVTVAGLSAGGAMAIVLGVTYPDLVATVGAVAGCPYQGLPCLGAPSLVPDAVAGQAAFEAMGERARAVPLVIVQGDADTTVPPANADRITGQWLAMADLIDDGDADGSVSSEPSAQREVPATAESRAASVRTYGLGGCGQLERWDVAGLGHAWPGGDPAGGEYADPLGPDATRIIWDAATTSHARCGDAPADEGGGADAGAGGDVDGGGSDDDGRTADGPDAEGAGDDGPDADAPVTPTPTEQPAARLPATGGSAAGLGALLLAAAAIRLRRPAPR